MKRMILIGCGGIGTWLGHGLSKALQFQAPGSALFLVDGDTFEPSNASRQAFTQLGAKATVLRDDIQATNQNIFVFAKPAWIVSEEVAREQPEEEADEGGVVIDRITIESLMEEDDVVYVVVDNYAARKLVFDAARNYDNIDVFTGGNGGVEDGDPLFGSVYHYRRREGRDITMHPGDAGHTEYVEPKDRNPGEMSCQERAELEGGTQLLAINMAVAANLLAKTSQTIFGTEEQETKALDIAEVYFDLAEGLALGHDRRPVQNLVPASS